MYTFFMAFDVSLAIINVFSCNTLQVARREYFIVYFSPESLEVKWVLHVVPNVNVDRKKARKNAIKFMYSKHEYFINNIELNFFSFVYLHETDE